MELGFLLKEQILITITLLGAIQGIVLSLIVLLYPERDKISNKLLSLFIFSLVIILIAPIMPFIIGWKYIWIMHSLKFLPIGALYIYIKSLSQEVNFRNSWIHFAVIPSYAPLAYYNINYILTNYGEEGFTQVRSNPVDHLLLIVNFGYFFFYLFLYYKAYLNHKQKIISNFSSINKLGLNWIRQLIIGYATIILFSTIMVAFMFNNPNMATTACIINMSVFTIFLYFVTIKGKLSPEIYKLRQIETEKINKSSLSPQQNTNLDNIALLVKDAFEKDQLFKKENLNIKELSEKINIQSYIVSQSINNVLGKNFFELVNEYRVEEAKKLLDNPNFNHLSLVGIGFEAGFNSKTTFNTAFKKVTGLTPSQYKRDGPLRSSKKVNANSLQKSNT